jgi:hypothetical protein
MKRKRERERKKATQSQEERAQAEEKGGEVVEKEERQQVEATRRVAGTDALYVDPPSVRAPR